MHSDSSLCGLHRSPACAACNSVIKGQYVQALGQCWHPEHFVCTECNKPFVGTLRWHTLVCPVCGRVCPRAGDKFRKHEDKPYCDSDYEKLFGLKCSKCSQTIEGQVFEALNKKFHMECFGALRSRRECVARCQHKACDACVRAVCEAGAHPIGEAAFHVYDEKIYCATHFEELFLQRCAGCSNIIKVNLESSRTAVLNFPWRRSGTLWWRRSTSTPSAGSVHAAQLS
jgi:hypothetical protein